MNLRLKRRGTTGISIRLVQKAVHFAAHLELLHVHEITCIFLR